MNQGFAASSHFGFTGCTRKNRSAHVVIAFQDVWILTVPLEIIAALHSITLPTVYQTITNAGKTAQIWFFGLDKISAWEKET